MKMNRRVLLAVATCSMFLHGLPVMATGTEQIALYSDNTSLESAEKFSPGSTISGGEDGRNSYYYTFTVSSAGKIILTNRIHSWCSFDLYDENFEKLSSWNGYPDGNTGMYAAEDVRYIKPGTYYLRLNLDTKGAAFTINTKFESSSVSFKENSSSDNDTLEKASPISLGKTYNGLISLNNRADYYKVTLSKSGQLNYVVNTKGDMDFDLYTEDLKHLNHRVLWASSNSGTGLNEYSHYLNSGTYYIQFKGYYGNTGPYSFNLNLKSANETFKDNNKEDVNGSLENASSIRLGQTVHGMIPDFMSDTDYYRISLPSGKYILETNGDDNWKIFSFYTSGGRYIDKLNPRTTELKETEFTLKEDADYIKVEGNGNGIYSFKLKKVSTSNNDNNDKEDNKNDNNNQTDHNTDQNDNNDKTDIQDDFNQDTDQNDNTDNKDEINTDNTDKTDNDDQSDDVDINISPLGEWIQDGNNWYYITKDGSYIKNQEFYDAVYYRNHYRFDSQGRLVKGWYTDSKGNRYYYDQSGARKTKWLKYNQDWYHFNDDGIMTKSKWVTDKSKYYKLDSSGKMLASQWTDHNGLTVYVDNSGAIKTSSWLKLGNDWYFLTGDGTAATGWCMIDNKMYYLYPSTSSGHKVGSMAHDVYINGTWVNEDGVAK